MKEYTKKEMLTEFLKGSKRYFVYAFFFTTLSSLVEMIRPKIIEYTVDGILDNELSSFPSYLIIWIQKIGGLSYIQSHLWIPALLIVLCTFVSVVFNYLYQMATIKAGETFVKRMRDQLFAHIQHVSVQWHSEHQTGDIIQRCTTDVEEVKMFLSDMLVNLIKMLITIILAFIFMFQIHFQLGLVAFISIPVMVAYSFWFHKKIQAGFLKCDESEGTLSTIAQENLTGIRVVRAFGQEKREKEKFATQNNIVTSHWVDLAKFMCSFWAMSDGLTGLVYLIILALGSVMCVHHTLTVGALLAMISYLTMLTRPVRSMGRLLSEMSKTGVSIQRLYEIMKSDQENSTHGKCVDMDQDITFSHVSFSYPGQDELLKDISFTIPAGTTLGILGSTGSGKSTIAHLLSRLYDCDQGCITIGNTSIVDIQRQWIRKNIGFVLQEPFLFSRSIADNISITSKDMKLEDIKDYARYACLEKTVDEFTEGFDTYVGERGVTLSGGQKQRVAIARTLSLDTPILIFDDSLSAVDTQTDARIRENLMRFKNKKTIIFISHRISTLMDADQILVLEDGRIQDRGCHAELIAHDGLYKTIYDIQQGKDGVYES